MTIDLTKFKIPKVTVLEIYSGWTNYYRSPLGIATVGQDLYKTYVFFGKFEFKFIYHKWRSNYDK